MSVSTYDCYVANLPLHYHENDIREIFAVAGEIVGVKILPAKHNAETKVAFVKFTTESDAHCCAQYMNNHELDDGTKIKVRYRPTSQENGMVLANSVVKPNEQCGASKYNTGIKVPYEEDDDERRKIESERLAYERRKVESNVNGTFESKHKSNNYVPYKEDAAEKVESNGSGSFESKRKFNDTNNNYTEETMIAVVVSHVESPIEFWAQSSSLQSEAQLKELTVTLAKTCHSQPKVIGQLSTEQMYGCKFSEDGLWYRCIVEKSLAKNEVHVRYIDYGNAEVTNRFGLVTLPDYILAFPPFCECYQLEEFELVSNDPQSDVFDKGLEELNELINEEKIYVKIIRKEKATLVKVFEDTDGTPLDVSSVLMPTGAVRLKAVSRGASWATAVRKTHAPPQSGSAPAKPNNRSAGVNGNDGATKNARQADTAVKPTTNHVKPGDSFVRPLTNHADLPAKPANSHFKPQPLVNQDDWPVVVPTTHNVKPLTNQDSWSVNPTDSWSVCTSDSWSPSSATATKDVKPTTEHIKPTDSHVKPHSNQADWPVIPSTNDMKPLLNHDNWSVNPAADDAKAFSTHVDSSLKPATDHAKPTDYEVTAALNHIKPMEVAVAPLDNHVKPLDNQVKPLDNQVKPPVNSMLEHVAYLESLEASSKHFNPEPPSKVDVQPPPGFNEQGPTSKPEVAREERIQEVECVVEEAAVPEQCPPNEIPKQRRLYSETESTSSVNSEVSKENDDNSGDIIEQLKIQLAEKTALLENYHRQRSISTSTSSVGAVETASLSENRCVENVLTTDSVAVGSLYIPGEEDSKEDLKEISCESTIIGHLEMDTDKWLSEMELPKVTIKNIGGYKKEVGEIKGVVDMSLNHADLFGNMGIQPPRGVLICGPHGTGKTLIARAIASESQAFLKEISGTSLVSASPDVSSRRLMKAFSEVAKNAPSILIVDQVDAIAPKRKEGGTNELLAQLLAQLNHLRNKVVLVCTANRSSALDPALKRSGLFAKEVTINKPDESNRLEILRVLTKDLELSKGLCLSKLAQETQEYSGLNLATFCTLATTHALEAKVNSISPNKKDNGSLKKLTIRSADFKFALAQMNSAVHKIAVEVPNTTWNEVCGMESKKSELKDLINHSSHSYEEKLLDFGCVPSKGILLYGPHGCGKKLLAKAMSNECKCTFLCVKGYELTASESTLGDNSCNVVDVFAKARKYAPCMLYIEELDLVTPSMDLVNEMLTEIDNIGDKENVYVIGATNRPSQVHPAFRYSGRLHNLVHIPLPGQHTRKSILERKMKHLGKWKKTNGNGNVEKIVKMLEGFNVTDLQKIVHRVCKTKGEIDHQHFEEALKYIRPSVTKADVEGCTTFITDQSNNTSDTTHTNDEAMSSLLENVGTPAPGTHLPKNGKTKTKNGVSNGAKSNAMAEISKSHVVISHDTLLYISPLVICAFAFFIYLLNFYINSSM